MDRVDFAFEELKSADTAAFAAWYDLYKLNFPLEDEQETPENLRLCMSLNDDERVQSAAEPYHEIYLSLRERHGAVRGNYIAAGLTFGVSTSQAHLAAGFLCSVQAIYLFRANAEPVRRFLYAHRSEIEREIIERARTVCRTPRFSAVIGGAEAMNIAILFEANNPLRMSDKQKTDDHDLSHVDPALRYVMWTRNKSAPLDFRYVQPPLSADQAAVLYLDLFAITAPLTTPGTEARLSTHEDGRAGLPGALLAAHLRGFFRVSVLKGNGEQIAAKCLPPPFDDMAAGELSMDEYCNALAARAFVPLKDPRSAEAREIRDQACAASVTTARELVHRADPPAWQMQLIKLWQRVRGPLNNAATVIGFVLLGVGSLGVLISRYFAPLTMAENALTILFSVLLLGRAVLDRWRRRLRMRHDNSARALGKALPELAARLALPPDGVAQAMRKILADRARHYLTVSLPLAGLDETPQGEERRALAAFVAGVSLAPEASLLIPKDFKELAKQRSAQMRTAFQSFPAGLLQGLYDPTPWQAYYSVLLPVDPSLLEDEERLYARLADAQKWLDKDVAAMLAAPAPAATDRLRAHAEAGGRVCLFVVHLMDRLWDEADPGAPADVLRPRLAFGAPPPMTALQTQLAPCWPESAEFACGRLLTAASHLALIVGRMAVARRITTDLVCPCTIIVHVPVEPTVRLLRKLGFAEVLPPAGQRPAGALTGSLLRVDVEPGAFVAALEAGGAAGAMLPFVGLLDELAQDQKRLMA